MNPWDPHTDQTSLTPEQRLAPRQTAPLDVDTIRRHIESITGGFVTQQLAPSETAPMHIPEHVQATLTLEQLIRQFSRLTSMIFEHGEFAPNASVLEGTEPKTRADYNLAA